MTELEPHVFVSDDPKKTVPCVVCGRPCVVHAYAATKFVKCNEHRAAGKHTGKRSSLNPLEQGLSFTEVRDRLQGRRIVQRVGTGSQQFEQELICGYPKDRGEACVGLRDIYDDGDGQVLHIIARDGGHRFVRRESIVSVR